MKQHISEQQLNNLSFKDFEKVREIANVCNGDKELISSNITIGKMLEVLDSQDEISIYSLGTTFHVEFKNSEGVKHELCDALWTIFVKSLANIKGPMSLDEYEQMLNKQGKTCYVK